MFRRTSACKNVAVALTAGRSLVCSTGDELLMELLHSLSSFLDKSHIAYILTIPTELGDVQEDFGLQERGSWIVQSKSPK
jgi:hypothetical protein